MKDNFDKLFTSLPATEPPDGLLRKTLDRLEKARERRAFKRLVLLSLGLIASATALVPLGRMFYAEVSASGFWQFFSLIFSDFGAVTVVWQNFILTLLETLPVYSLAGILLVTFVFLELLKYLAVNLRIIFYHKYYV
jgi:hypothetical protein